MSLTDSRDPIVRGTAPTLATGKKWTTATSVLQAKSAVRHRNVVVFLDLANAFGSVPHKILWMAFNYFSVPNHITRLVTAYFQDLQFCVTAENTTTAWQHLEIGVMAGCTISPQAFIMAMESVMWASR